MSGYIKLHRAVRGTAIAHHPEYFAAWVHLLCMASHKSHQQIVGTKIIDLEPGQLVFGRQRFSATTGISENKIRSALLVLKELHMITSKSHTKFSIISIINWSKYQDSPPANNHKTTSKPPANHHEQECIKNEDKVKTKDSVELKPDVAGDVIEYLNLKSGRSYRNVKTHADHINARIKQGYTLEDIKAVIDRKCQEWANDTEMQQYLRPSTLFNNEKFNNYAGQLDAPLPEKKVSNNGYYQPPKRTIRDFPQG